MAFTDIGERRQRYVTSASCFDTARSTNLSALGEFTVSLNVPGMFKKYCLLEFSIEQRHLFFPMYNYRVYLRETRQNADIHSVDINRVTWMESLQQLART